MGGPGCRPFPAETALPGRLNREAACQSLIDPRLGGGYVGHPRHQPVQQRLDSSRLPPCVRVRGGAAGLRRLLADRCHLPSLRIVNVRIIWLTLVALNGPDSEHMCKATPKASPIHAGQHTRAVPSIVQTAPDSSTNVSHLPRPTTEQGDNSTTTAPRVGEHLTRLPLMRAPGPASTGSAHFPHPGHPWPGQRRQSVQRGESATTSTSPPS